MPLNIYNTFGYLEQVRRNDNNALIWECESVNVFGGVTQQKYGNNLTTVKDYDITGILRGITTGNVQDLEYSFSHETGNLIARRDNIRELTELFGYNDLGRLTGVSGPAPMALSYASNGNIHSKSMVGSYTYGTKPHAVASVSNPNGLIPAEEQRISYTSFNKTDSIIQATYLNVFTYGHLDQRTISRYFENDVLKKTTWYAGDYEVEMLPGQQARRLHYISGGDGLAAIYVKYESIDTMYYVHADHLGSFDVITNQSGSAVQYYSFDAWGRRRNPANWTYANVPSAFLFARGFTGHEHLDVFALINMNGRMYDPLLGRFLAPDNFVQAPDFSQSFNRYSYCLNNPLIYTDPDGEFFWIAVGIGALIGAYIGGSASEGWQMNPTKWKWDKDTWKGVGLGAVFGAAGGAGFAYAAPALAKTAFFANFGVSGTIGAYTITGAVAGGAIGYTSGFGGGMIYSNGDWGYSHQSGIFGAQLGGTIGAAVGTVAGLLTPESREWIAGMFSSPPALSVDIPLHDPYTLTAGPGGNSSGIRQADWSDPTDTYYGTMNSFRHIYKGNKNPAHPYGHWHVNDLYKNTPNPSGWNQFWGSMSGALSVSRTYTNGVAIRITDYQYYHVERWRYNYIGGITIPDPPPYVINAHFPSYPIRGIISVVFSNQAIYYEWLRFLQY